MTVCSVTKSRSPIWPFELPSATSRMMSISRSVSCAATPSRFSVSGTPIGVGDRLLERAADRTAQQRGFDRFRDVGVRARGEGLLHPRSTVIEGENDRHDPRVAIAETLDHANPVQIGQIEFQQHGIRAHVA